MLRGRFRPFPARLIVAAALLTAMLAAACGGGDGAKLSGPAVTRPPDTGQPRTVAVGFGALPAGPRLEDYVAAFATAAQDADIIMIQRAPPWADFLPGAKVSPATGDATALETRLMSQYQRLSLFFAIDPTDPAVQRSRVAALPPGVDASAGFNDPGLREAFKAYVTYVASNYRPRYLALGVEVNMLYERARPQFDAFVSLYREAYDIAKAASPGTLVFPTFQLEDLEGTLGQSHSPHWEVLDSFSGKIDALVVSSYPYLGGVRVAADVRKDYFSQLANEFAGPTMIAAVGYSSAPVEGESVIGTEQDQQAFLARLFEDAEAAGIDAVVWAAADDPAVAGGAASVLQDVGLRHAGGAPKLAWSTWAAFAHRPLQ